LNNNNPEPDHSLSLPGLFKSVAPLILLLNITSLVGFLGVIIISFKLLDDIAENNYQERLQTALSVETQRQEDLLIEYSLWDEAHDNLIKEANYKWAEINTGSYMHEKYGIDFSIAVTGDMRPTISFVNGERSELLIDGLLSAGVDQLLKSSLSVASNYKIASAFVRFQDQDYLVSVSPFMNEEDTSLKSDGSFLVIAQLIDDEFIEHLYQSYKLPVLSMVAHEDISDSVLVLKDIHDNEFALIHWVTPMPSTRFLPWLITFVVVSFLVISLLAWWVIFRDVKTRKQYEAELYQLATKDFLTGISNRREFTILSNRELQRAARKNEPVSLLLLDIDHFKHINDKFGHKAGDSVLSHFSTLVQDDLRDFDIFSRIGGEEFAILLPGVDRELANKIAERIRKHTEQVPFVTDKEEPVAFTVSIGIISSAGDNNLEQLMHNADIALYQAKGDGRNRFCHFDG